ncbi:MAG TPA: glycerophosphodiester phosphodiesterase family protein, partial [Bryobacterales bacterium]|nr:glycerophosphodiester phosphodiesterase family protein [Bryobacterales bacterium]
AAHAAGLQVIPWTPDQPDQWLKLIEDGADAIITDDPEALIAFLTERGLRAPAPTAIAAGRLTEPQRTE